LQQNLEQIVSVLGLDEEVEDWNERKEGV
jgi:hypothetical protein